MLIQNCIYLFVYCRCSSADKGRQGVCRLRYLRGSQSTLLDLQLPVHKQGVRPTERAHRIQCALLQRRYHEQDSRVCETSPPVPLCQAAADHVEGYQETKATEVAREAVGTVCEIIRP